MRNAAIWGCVVGLLLLPLGGGSHPVAGQEAAKLPPRYYALLVGVQQYDPNELRPLPYAEPDVEELSQLLTKRGFRRVVLMTQAAGAKQYRLLPTSGNIRTTLKGLLANKREQDVVLVALAGHGVQFKGEDAAYFCPMDAKLADRTTLISLKELYDALDACQAGTRLLLVDACRNDPQSDNSRSAQGDRVDSITRPQRVKPPGGVAALFSCSAGQKAFESSELKHGIFFHAVIEGLRGKADFHKKDPLTWDELVAWTRAEVPDLVADIYGDGVRQDPELTGRMRGNIALLPASALPDRKMPRSPKNLSAGETMRGNKVGEVRSLTGHAIKFCWCPAGSFRMGSPPDEEGRDGDEGPVTVTLSHGFWLGQTEVTQEQWKAVMGTEPWVEHNDGDTKRYKAGSDFPAIYINYTDTLAFCRELTSQERAAGRLPSDWEYTLPSEAQWEYACRAGPGRRRGIRSAMMRRISETTRGLTKTL